jgi:4'-phosphopantetheinyl transferase
MFTTFDMASLPPDCALAWAVDAPGVSQPAVTLLGDPLTAIPIRPPGDGLVLWLGTLAPETDLSAFAVLAGLSEAERAQMSAFYWRRDAIAYAAGHGALRLILGAMLNRPPSALQFRTGPHGKPFLCPPCGTAGEPIQFNISHSKGLAAVGLSSQAIGIDIEQVTWRDDLLDVARLSFANEQLASLVSASGDRRTNLFFRYWTLGEAFIKATGVGISQGLDSFAFTPDGPPRLTRVTPGWGPIERWHFGVR